MELQESDAARGRKLTKLSISAEQLETLDLQAKSAEALYQQALAVRENAKINLDRTTVYAPVNGYVTTSSSTREISLTLEKLSWQSSTAILFGSRPICRRQS